MQLQQTQNLVDQFERLCASSFLALGAVAANSDPLDTYRAKPFQCNIYILSAGLFIYASKLEDKSRLSINGKHIVG